MIKQIDAELLLDETGLVVGTYSIALNTVPTGPVEILFDGGADLAFSLDGGSNLLTVGSLVLTDRSVHGH